jgi:catechol 2,3-dioxygenase-like lactoylglutathione lyase family enzyme
MEWHNQEFDLGGVNHLALVCSDMKRTVEFYTQVLGMRLIKTLDLPGGSGQHFFFDMGGVTRWPSSGSPTPRTLFPASQRR